MTGIHNAKTWKIDQHHVFRDGDIGQVNFSLIDEEDIGVIFGDVIGEFIKSDFLGGPTQFVPAFNQDFEFFKELLLVEGAVLGSLPLNIAAKAC